MALRDSVRLSRELISTFTSATCAAAFFEAGLGLGLAGAAAFLEAGLALGVGLAAAFLEAGPEGVFFGLAFLGGGGAGLAFFFLLASFVVTIGDDSSLGAVLCGI